MAPAFWCGDYPLALTVIGLYAGTSQSITLFMHVFTELRRITLLGQIDVAQAMST